MREVIDYVLCALCIVCLGRAVSWNRQDCNKQRMQRMQKTWSTGTGLCQNFEHESSFPNRRLLTAVVKHNKTSPVTANAFPEFIMLPLP